MHLSGLSASCSVTILAVNGTTVTQPTIVQDRNIDVSRLAAGNYFIKIFREGSVKVLRFVKL